MHGDDRPTRSIAMSRRPTLKGGLYIYAPPPHAEASADERLEVDALVPLDSTHACRFTLFDPHDGRSFVVRRSFSARTPLRELIPSSLWPTADGEGRRLRIRLEVDDGQRLILSQRNYVITLIRQRQPKPDTDRGYCALPWTYLRLGHVFATPCSAVIPGFRVPAHARTSYSPWNGDTLVRLRQTLVDGTRSYCSTTCPHYSRSHAESLKCSADVDPVIRTNLLHAQEAYEDGLSMVAHTPTTVAISMGNACNYDCAFCSIHASKNRFRLNGHYLELAKNYFRRAHRAFFTGGEPLLYGNAIEQIFDDQAGRPGKIVKIMTNGRLLNESLALLGLPHRLFLSINLNTFDPRLYRFLHGTDGIREVLTGIDRTRSRRGGAATHVEVKAIVMRSTTGKLVDFARQATDLGVRSVVFSRLRLQPSHAIDAEEQIAEDTALWHEARAELQAATAHLRGHGVRVVSNFP
jgi:pyruvate-formate lyase-activating enzyme